MKYCCDCGGPVSLKLPDGDNRPRYTCERCYSIHYQNPRVVVGCLPTTGDKVLLCRRAIEPRYGLWTIPAGFMENGETMLEGALRETQEEAAARVRDEKLYRMIDIPAINQVYVFFRGELDGDFGAGPESLESRLFSKDEVPWSELAFPEIADILADYFVDLQRNDYPIRLGKPAP